MSLVLHPDPQQPTGGYGFIELPGSSLPMVVHKVSPVFSENEKGIAYRVEAGLEEQVAGLRPGMEGVAKIDIDQRSFAWIYLHELFDVIRLWVWRWLP